MVDQELSALPSVSQSGAMSGASVGGVSVKLGLLRGFDLTCNGLGVPLSRGLQRLLAYLALNRSASRRTHVAAVLWDDVTDQRAAGNLRSALWRLRHVPVHLVGSTSQHLGLAASVAVDVREAERLARLVLDPSMDTAAVRLEDLHIAGELLPGWDEEWVLLERERLRQISLHVLDALCERWTRAGRLDEAVMAGLAAVTSEPLRESSHRALIAALFAEGNQTEALRRYAIYKETLWRELRLQPSQQISAMLNAAAVTHG
jgi:DNA-binding SARP family transcriptional activator